MLTPRPIRSLDETLINQIAAGEVIERPASAVKELVENSLDAGASSIDIVIEQGGQKLIRISDDGCGIPKQELQLALTRHATSKISSYDELTRVMSMGFRGEALASIASVAEVSLTSRTAADSAGWKLVVSPASPTAEPEPVAAPFGTTVSVEQLFFSTPVRRRFLRSVRTEFQHILEWVRRLALAHPQVSFRLTHEQRCVLQLPAVTAGNGLDSEAGRNRIDRVFGRNFTRQSRSVDVSADGMRLSGFLGAPDAARSQSDRQFLFINRRLVRDQGLMHAVRLAYDKLLGEGLQPVYLLWLDIDPVALDVNVHPAKSEVRFSQPRQVHDFVAGQAMRLMQSVYGDQVQAGPADHVLSAQAASDRAIPRPVSAAESRIHYQPGRPVPAQGKRLPAMPDRSDGIGTQGYCSAIGRRFLIRTEPDRLTVLDLAGALPAFLHQALKQQHDSGSISSQPVLIPPEVTLDSKARQRLLSLSESLLQLGLEFRPLDESTLRLIRMPALLRGSSTTCLLQRLPVLLAAESFRASDWIEQMCAGQLPQPAELATPTTCQALWLRLEQGLGADRFESYCQQVSEETVTHWFEAVPRP